MPYIGISESQSSAEAEVPQVALYADLRAQLAWFRTEWQAALPEKLHLNASQVDDGDHLGGPAMTRRFRDYLTETPRDPLRQAMAEMTKGGLLESSAARFLFVLACQDFDVVAAGYAVRPPITAEYASYYADKAIGRLRERMRMLDRPRRSHRACAEDDCTTRTDRLYCADHARDVA